MFIPVSLFFFIFYFYMRTHCATFNINDSGETIMVCDLLTISHSPGYPLHTLWGRVNCLLPLGKPMFRVTFSSILTGSISAVVLYLTVKMFLKNLFQGLGAGTVDRPSGNSSGSEAALGNDQERASGPWLWEIPALFTGLVFAFSYQHWFQACGAKGGIYTLNTLLSVCMLYLFYKMRESGWYAKSLLLMGFLYGLSLAHHWPNQIVMAPAYFWFLIVSQKKIPLEKVFNLWHLFWGMALFIALLVVTLSFYSPPPVPPGAKPPSFSMLPAFAGTVLCWVSFFLVRAFGVVHYVRAVILSLLSLSTYIYLPIRSTQNPLVDWWNPQGLHRLIGTVLREGYKGIGDNRSWTTIHRNLDRFWMHAQHQFGDVFTFLIFALALFGIIWLLRRGAWTTMVGIGLFGGGVFSGVILFNNPLEGYQWTLDNFFSPVFLTVSVFAGAGVAGICEWAAKEWPFRTVPIYVSAACLGFALVPLCLNISAPESRNSVGQTIYKINDQSRYISSYDEGVNMFKTVNDDAVILCNGDIDILPLWYLQYVEGKRPKVITFTMQLIPYDWYRDPLFKKHPDIAVPVNPSDPRPETVVQAMIESHKDDRSFYFTNIFTAPWMRDKNPSIPDGFLWRIVNTKNLNYALTSERINKLWSTYRLRNMDSPQRGYWDEYTDVMKDSYGIGHDFTGYFAYMNHMPDLALWSFSNALKYRQPQTIGRIQMMLGETYMNMGNYSAAIASYQENLNRERNPYTCARIGDAFHHLGDMANAEAAYRASLTINPQQKEALEGLKAMGKTVPTIIGPANSHP